MPNATEALVERTLEQFHETMHAFLRMSAPEWLQLDLTMAQLKALFALTQEQPATVSSLGDALGIGISASSHLVDRLVQLQMVDRAEDPDDRRRTLVRLSSEGETLVARLRQGRRDRLTACLRRLTADELTALLEGLGALSVAANVVNRDAACRAPEASAAASCLRR